MPVSINDWMPRWFRLFFGLALVLLRVSLEPAHYPLSCQVGSATRSGVACGAEVIGDEAIYKCLDGQRK